MSCYNWESGTVQLSSKAWKPFRDSLMQSFNQLQNTRFAWLEKVHAKALEVKKSALRGKFVLHDTLTDIVQRRLVAIPSVLNDDDVFELVLLLKSDAGGLIAPKKKDFPKATSATKDYKAGWAGGIHLDSQRRIVSWHVSENNHAVEAAWESPMGSALHRALSSVTWTRGTGGVFTGNDEYNRDNEGEGAGGNYVTSRYGPLGENRPVRVRSVVRDKSYAKMSIR